MKPSPADGGSGGAGGAAEEELQRLLPPPPLEKRARQHSGGEARAMHRRARGRCAHRIFFIVLIFFFKFWPRGPG